MYRNPRVWPEKCPKTRDVQIAITLEPYNGFILFKLCFLSFLKSFNLRPFEKVVRGILIFMYAALHYKKV